MLRKRLSLGMNRDGEAKATARDKEKDVEAKAEDFMDVRLALAARG